MIKKKKLIQFAALGRRKKAVARVILREHTGGDKLENQDERKDKEFDFATLSNISERMLVNKQPINQYFPFLPAVKNILFPLILTGTLEKYQLIATIRGGGVGAQSDALRLGIANALIIINEEKYRPILKEHGLLTTDARIKERKKYGLKKARKAPQFSKR